MSQSQFDDAVRAFPIAEWLSRYVKVHDTGSDNFYIDCPVCAKRRGLGVHRVTKLSQCFKCADGHNRGLWTGRANLVGLIRLLAHVSSSQAAAIVYSESASRIRSSDESQPVIPVDQEFEPYPPESIPLSSASDTHPSVQFLHRRGMSHLIPRCRVCISGTYSHRVLLPATSFGRTFGYEAKSYVGHLPKSLFPDWMKTSHEVYATAWDTSADFAVITESILDAETFGVNAIGLFGSILRDGQLTRLIELRKQGVRRLVWALDEDAWRKQAKSIITKTGMLFENNMVRFPLNEDPNSVGRETCWSLVAQAQSAECVEDFLFEKLQ